MTAGVLHLMHSNRPYELRMILMHHMILMWFQPFHLSVTSLSSEYTSISILIFFTLLNLILLQLAKLILRLLIVLNLCIIVYLLLTRVAHVAPPELFWRRSTSRHPRYVTNSMRLGSTKSNARMMAPKMEVLDKTCCDVRKRFLGWLH